MNGIKKEAIHHYLSDRNTVQTTFRTLILFGKNVATYKFALCHALMKQKPQDSVRYEDLRDDFLSEFVAHYQENQNQFNSGTTKLTEAIDSYLLTDKSSQDWDDLVNVAEQSIYNNVFDAFQNVGGGTIDTAYQLFEHDKNGKKLILTNSTNAVLEAPAVINEILLENQSRWKVVEEAWRSKLSPNLLEFNADNNTFISVSSDNRVDLRSAVDVLLPYQKGQCFYCLRPVDRFAHPQDDAFPDVDHFLPRSLLTKEILNGANPDGVWNLVIACRNCNRGVSGKFDIPPDQRFFVKLLSRNLLLVEEHKHSLRNSIFISLNTSSGAGVSVKMKQLYDVFKIIRGWKPKELFADY